MELKKGKEFIFLKEVQKLKENSKKIYQMEKEKPSIQILMFLEENLRMAKEMEITVLIYILQGKNMLEVSKMI